jgi:transposase
LPIICIDARHANAALNVRTRPIGMTRPGFAQIIRTGWFKQVSPRL